MGSSQLIIIKFNYMEGHDEGNLAENNKEKGPSGLELWGSAMGAAMGISLAVDHVKSKEKEYGKVEKRILITNDEAVGVPEGQLLEVFHISNSKVNVSKGSMLMAASVSNSTIFVEPGGNVEVLKMDENSKILEQEKITNCVNCGAPLRGGKLCAYYGSSF